VSQFNFLIDIPVGNDWSKVDRLRDSVLNCVSSVYGDMDGCQTLAIVAGELLENALKYGKWETARRPFRLRACGFERKVELTVEHPVDTESPHLAELLETLKWIRGFSSPEEAYRTRLLQVAQRGGEDHESKLGLCRIAYESHCRLESELNGDMLRVTAEVDV
jgi:hypothetical protein